MPEDIEATLARIEQQIADLHEVTDENNELLLSMRRLSRVALFAKVLIWIAIIIIPFLLIGPIIDALVPALGSGQNSSGLFGFPSPDQIEELINTYQGEESAPQ